MREYQFENYVSFDKLHFREWIIEHTFINNVDE
jgi:hypothetical protein